MTGFEACKIAAQRCKELPGYRVVIYYDRTEEVTATEFSHFFLDDSRESGNDVRIIKMNNNMYDVSYGNGSYILVRPYGFYRGYMVNLIILHALVNTRFVAGVARPLIRPYIRYGQVLKAEIYQVSSWELTQEPSYLYEGEQEMCFQKSPELDKFLDSFKIIRGE